MPRGGSTYRRGGRKLGTPNKSKGIALDVESILRSRNISPIEELLDIWGIIPPTEKAKLCIRLQEFIQAKPIASAVTVAQSEQDQELIKRFKIEPPPPLKIVGDKNGVDA